MKKILSLTVTVFVMVLMSLTTAKAIAYCKPTYTACSFTAGPTTYYYGISSVTLNGVTRNSASCTTGAYDTSGINTSMCVLQKGKTYSIRLTSPSNNTAYGIWVDWNRDGDFSDKGEFIDSSNTGVQNYTSSNFKVSATQPSGNYRMRVRSGQCFTGGCTQRWRYTQACNSTALTAFTYGEAEDHVITVAFSKDLGVSAVVKPSANNCGLGSAETVSYMITSTGNDTLKTGEKLYIAYSVNGGSYAYDTFTLSNNFIPFSSIILTSKNNANLSTTGIYTFKIYTYTPGDSNSFNDTMVSSVYNAPVYSFPYTQKFDGTVFPTDWYNVGWDGNLDWEHRTGAASKTSGPTGDHTSGSGYYMYIDDGVTTGGPGGYARDADSIILYSPCIDISTTNNPYLEFWIHSNNGGSAAQVNTLYVDVVSNGVLTKAIANYTNEGNGWVKKNISLKGYKGTIRLRFRADNNNGARVHDIAIDDLRIYNQYVNDVGVTTNGIIAPASQSCGDSNTVVKVSITNYGSVSATNIPVKLTVTAKGFTTVIMYDTLKKTIPAGGVDTLTFKQTINTYKGYTLTFYANTYYSADSNQTNDTLKDFGNNPFVKLGLYAAIPRPVVTVGKQCGAGKVMMSVTNNSNGYFTNWFGPAGNWLAQGDTIYTPTINSTTQYTVMYTLTSIKPVHMGMKNSGAGGTFLQQTNYNQRGLYFNAYSNMTLDSVTVYPSSKGTVGIVILNAAGATIASTSVSVNPKSATSPVKIKVGLSVPKGNGYLIRADGSSLTGNGLGLNYNLATNPYPYTNTVASITGNYQGSAASNYYWFYDWVVTGTSSCSGPAITVDAVITPKPSGASFNKSTPFHGNYSAGTTASPDSVCSGDTLTYSFNPPTGFTNAEFGSKWNITTNTFTTKSGGSVSNVKWNDPTSSANGNLAFYPSASDEGTTFMQTTVITDAATGCDSTIVRYIYVNSHPVAKFGAAGVCNGATSIFYDSSNYKGNASFMYDFGDGNTLNTVYAINTHTYSKEGAYTVNMTVSTAGCTNKATRTIYVNPMPKVNFYTVGACPNEPVNFYDSSSLTTGAISSKAWNFGDGNTSTKANPTNTYTAGKTYNVKLVIVSDKNCKDSVTKGVVISTAPSPGFNIPSTICSYDSLPLKNTTVPSTSTYKWDFGDGYTTTDANPFFFYKSSGKFNINLVATNAAGCKDSLTKSITVKQGVWAFFTYTVDTTTNTVTFTMPDSTGTNYSWNFGDGGTATTRNATHTYSSKGAYTITATAGNGNCTNIINHKIGVGVVGVDEINASEFRASIQPNPFAENTTIAYSVAGASRVKISLNDITGKQVAILTDRNHTSGDYTLGVNANEYHLPAGIYMVRFELNNKTVVRQIIKLNQ